ncbi:MAG: DUF3617 family protein [Bdellovibrionales bacterium]|nr:DUF3617 family protein [Bdellovibrionales bacterium]
MKLTLLAVFLFSVTASAQNITPGLWKAKTKITLGGMSMPLFDVDDCISPAEAKDIKKYIQENLIPETQCTVKTWDYKKPDLKVTLTCENNQYKAKGNLSGKVTDKEFKIGGTLQGTHVVMGDISVGVDYDGKYTKACK